MNVRELFEKEYAESHNLPPETFEQYRMGESYRLPLIAKCWRFYSAGFYAGICIPDTALERVTE